MLAGASVTLSQAASFSTRRLSKQTAAMETSFVSSIEGSLLSIRAASLPPEPFVSGGLELVVAGAPAFLVSCCSRSLTLDCSCSIRSDWSM